VRQGPCSARARLEVACSASNSPALPRRGLLAAAAALHGGEALYELSVGNPDKGMLALEDVRRRVAQFTDAGLPLVVTHVRAPAGPVLTARLPGGAASRSRELCHLSA